MLLLLVVGKKHAISKLIIFDTFTTKNLSLVSFLPVGESLSNFV